jgi:hypothetical protein
MAEVSAVRAASTSGAWRTPLMAPRMVDMTPLLRLRRWRACRRLFFDDFSVGTGSSLFSSRRNLLSRRAALAERRSCFLNYCENSELRYWFPNSRAHGTCLAFLSTTSLRPITVCDSLQDHAPDARWFEGGPRSPQLRDTALSESEREPALRCRLRYCFCGTCRGRNPPKIAARGKFGNSHGDWHHELRPL